MSLVYAKKSDEIGCALRVFLHATVACSVWYRDLDVRGTSRIVWLRLYQSLLMYIAHMDLIGDPFQGTCCARASEILITKVRKIFYLGFRRIVT
jgi:hypothetical protein